MTSRNIPQIDFYVPGTSYPAVSKTCLDGLGAGQAAVYRDPRRRERYLTGVYDDVARLLGAIDRNPFRPTYGCLDRQYWHYRTACFASEMYQEGVLPLAQVYVHRLPGNRWHGNTRVRELAVAALRFAARSCHADGSCDDYYPFERALGAAVFSLQAAAEAYRLLDLDDGDLLQWFDRRASWLASHDESGHLTNHHALAALGLWRVAQITGNTEHRDGAGAFVERVLAWQDDEGWFEEYGGADPGYQTVTIDCLAKLRRATGDERLDEPIRRAVRFAHHFLHPDGSYAGEYGSRGTSHYYPHGMELLAGEMPEATDLADGFLHALANGTYARFNDDRLLAHQLGNRIEAYLDWSPLRPEPQPATETGPASVLTHMPSAGLLVRRVGGDHTVISTARGGVFKHFAAGHCTTDAGLLVELEDGTVAVSQVHDRNREIDVETGDDGSMRVTVSGLLKVAKFETATPLKQSVLHLGMWSVGRWCRNLVRRLLQRRLITGGRTVPVRLTRTFVLPATDADLQVTDRIELTAPSARVRRLAFGTDHQSAYVAACGVYQDSVLEPWTELSDRVEMLNRDRQVVIERLW